MRNAKENNETLCMEQHGMCTKSSENREVNVGKEASEKRAGGL